MKNEYLQLVENRVKKDVERPQFRAGDTVRVHFLVKEAEKERIQMFEGHVIRRHDKGASSTFTVRKTSFGIGVERIFPLYSPLVKKIEVKEKGEVRRARLYYLRRLSGKSARIKTEGLEQGMAVPQPPSPATTPAAK